MLGFLSSRKRQERADVITLSKLFHRGGLDPSITQAYLDGKITVEQWQVEANRVSAEMDSLGKDLIAKGVPADALRTYFVDGTMSYDELENIVNKCLGGRLLEIADAYSASGAGSLAK